MDPGTAAATKAPAAMCRKVIEAVIKKSQQQHLGPRRADAQLLYIDDCVKGIDMNHACDELIATR